MTDQTITERVEQCALAWDVNITTRHEATSSVIAYGTCGSQPVVLKVVRQENDEWHGGATLAAFEGAGTVRVLAHQPGAVLLERLLPGTSLLSLVREDRDDEATAILALVIREMARGRAVAIASPRVDDWGRGFARYLAGSDRSVSFALVERAQQTFRTLSTSQREPRLLHGDLHHENVLFDRQRGWVAIDPKGVVGEVEYEVGASLRNPRERPTLISSAQAVQRRVKIFEAELGIDVDRTLRWAFAQGVLSALWSVEDGEGVDETHTGLVLAKAIESMLT